MGIEGLTHEKGELIKVTKYKGKISTGYAPGEGPNTGNHPVAAGFFRMLKEVTRTERIGREKKIVNIKEWVLNEQVQKELEKSLPTANPNPRRIEIVCLFKNPNEMWDSSLAMYSQTDGLLCKSHGLGTTARQLQLNGNGERTWIDRNGQKGCQFRNCPDFVAGKCKPMGLLKCFPVVDMSPNPYRFETRSINTIIGIESAFVDLGNLLWAAHAVKQMEAGHQLPFDGFFGAKLYLVHRKVKSGGRDVYITDLMPTNEFTESVMDPIRRGIEKKNTMSKLVGEAGTLSILDKASQKLLGHEDADIEEAVPLDIDDERGIAAGFPTNSDEGEEPSSLKEDEKSPEVKQSDDFSSDKGKNVLEGLIGKEKPPIPEK